MLIVLPISILFLLVVGLCAQDVWRELAAPQVRAVPPDDGQPLVSVLIPARNEAARLGPCLAGLAAQTTSRFETIVVDDDSSDGTGDLARGFAGHVAGLQVLDGAPLPAGWAGKCWACWQAAGMAGGEWLLFLDADVLPQPALIASLLAYAADADLVTMMPRQHLGTAAERMLLPAFHSILLGVYPLHIVSNQAYPLAFANGQCLLVRRDVYFATDGHRAVRDSVLEDTDYGQIVKAAGYRLLAANGPVLLGARMYHGWRSAAEGLGKNAVAGFRSGGARSGLVGARQSLIAFAPLYLLLAGAWLLWAQQTVLGWAVMLHGAALLLTTLGCSGWLVQQRYRIGWWWGLLYPFGLALYFGLALRGLIQVRSGRGVMWKGRRLAG